MVHSKSSHGRTGLLMCDMLVQMARESDSFRAASTSDSECKMSSSSATGWFMRSWLVEVGQPRCVGSHPRAPSSSEERRYFQVKITTSVLTPLGLPVESSRFSSAAEQSRDQIPERRENMALSTSSRSHFKNLQSFEENVMELSLIRFSGAKKFLSDPFSRGISAKSFSHSAKKGDAYITMSDRVAQNDDSKLDAKQKSLLDTEQLILLNEKDEPIGADTKKNCHSWLNKAGRVPLHRGFSVYLFNSKKEFLLTQRAATKVMSPLRFTNTCCSHPWATPEESEEKAALGVKRAAVRRLSEELGIPKGAITPDDLWYMHRFYYEVKSSEVYGWGEHEIYYLFVCVKDVELNPDPNEVNACRYVKRSEFDEFKRQLETNELVTTPWFKHIAMNYLGNYWDNLDNLKPLQDHKTIHELDLPDF
ncbi:unnamed protein product [Notodromas monacha]|uniref:isopentenyl-diphosphate Delta-isomerase n=1 Tax=Notodromas monacha TaxID=399045 RepID=A0A7R9BYC8_9CRUS|nr:unnamed protein product [Notodromas monacha]CAG0923646.1 unnamed protein product [Notodromas monacha]